MHFFYCFIPRFSASPSLQTLKGHLLLFSSRLSFGIRKSLSTRYRSRWMRIRMEALLRWGGIIKSRGTGPGDATAGGFWTEK